MQASPRALSLVTSLVVAATAAAAPQYQIIDLGVVQVSDTHSYGFGVSPAGIAVGRSGNLTAGQAFTWTQGGGLMGLPILSGRDSCVANSANDSGIVVGKAFNANFSGTDLPVIWQSGVVSQLPLPPGYATGAVFDVNASGVAVGSAGDGLAARRGVIYGVGGATIITPTTPNGSYFSTANAINDSGRIVGWGVDPSDQFIRVGIVYDTSTNTTFSIGTFQGANSAIAFGVNNNGQIVGISNHYLDLSYPFIWTEGVGMVAIPLLEGTNTGTALGVNSAGWVVGLDSLGSSYTPFLYDGTTIYRLADLLPAGSGWTLPNYNVSISDNGVIVGTGVHNGATRAFAMVPVPATPTPTPTGTPTPTPAPITTRLVVSVRTEWYQHFPFSVMVSARDQFNNTAVGYTGTVHFTTTAGNANLPADSTLTNGSAIFSASIGSPGTHTITATDTSNPSITGTSNPITLFSEGSPTPTPPSTPTPGTPTPTVTPSPTPPPPTPTVTPSPTAPSPTVTPTPTPSPPLPAQAMNLSTRMLVQTGENVGIGGFIIAGSAPKHVLLRAVGPELAQVGVPNPLADPVLELHGPPGFVTIINDNCVSGQFDPPPPFCPPGSLSAVIDATLNPGAYTAVVRGKNNTTGVALVEVYDVDQGANSKLANISTRAFVGTGDNIVIAGFILGGNSGDTRIIVRGIGRTLYDFGIANPLADPTLELRDNNGSLILANNDWQDTPTGNPELIAAGLAPTYPEESGIAATLPPGLYTVLLAGHNGGTGVGVVEVYERGVPGGATRTDTNTRHADAVANAIGDCQSKPDAYAFSYPGLCPVQHHHQWSARGPTQRVGGYGLGVHPHRHRRQPVNLRNHLLGAGFGRDDGPYSRLRPAWHECGHHSHPAFRQPKERRLQLFASTGGRHPQRP